MNHSASALLRLRRMVAGAQEPVLDDDALSALLDMYAMADSSGSVPGDSAYTAVYDWYGAAAEGWRWKAADAAHQTTFNADGSSFNLSDLIAHCEGMAHHYENLRATGNITI